MHLWLKIKIYLKDNKRIDALFKILAKAIIY